MQNKKVKQILFCGMHFAIFVAFFALSAGDPAIGEVISLDRRVDWDPGVRGGIPNRTTIFANVKDAPYNAQADGQTDDSTAI